MKSFNFSTTALLGATGLALFAGPALAQPDAAATYDWSGPYVGANVGWNNNQTSVHGGTATTQQLTGVDAGAGPVTVPPATFNTARMDFSGDSFAAGGQVGFNHQVGHVVVGLEGDMDAVGGHSGQLSTYTLPATALTTSSTVAIARRSNPNWTATVRGRVGWAMDRVLFYGTGGLALADERQSAVYAYTPTVTSAVAAANPGTTFGTTFNSASGGRTMVGWTLGGGAEYRLNHAVSIGAEYRHSDYGDHTYTFAAAGPGLTNENPTIHVADDQVLAKVNFHFAPGGWMFWRQ
jgi:outer membrane immunogenic protein